MYVNIAAAGHGRCASITVTAFDLLWCDRGCGFSHFKNFGLPLQNKNQLVPTTHKLKVVIPPPPRISIHNVGGHLAAALDAPASGGGKSPNSLISCQARGGTSCRTYIYLFRRVYESPSRRSLGRLISAERWGGIVRGIRTYTYVCTSTYDTYCTVQ